MSEAEYRPTPRAAETETPASPGPGAANPPEGTANTPQSAEAWPALREPPPVPTTTVLPRRHPIQQAIVTHLIVLGAVWLLTFDHFPRRGLLYEGQSALAIAEVSLVAIYLAESRKSLGARLGLALIVVVGAAFYNTGLQAKMALLFGLLFACQTVSIAAPLFVLASLGRRVALPAPGQPLPPGLQFTLKHIAVWMISAACLMTVGRWWSQGLLALDNRPAIVGIAAYLAFTFATLTLGSIWAVLSEGRPGPRCALLLGIAAVLAWGYQGVNPSYTNTGEIVRILGSMTVILAWTLAAFRRAGYRFVRVA